MNKLILIFCTVATGMFASDKELTIEQSLIPVFGRHSEEMENVNGKKERIYLDNKFPYNRLNPGIRPALRHIISDNNFKYLDRRIKVNALILIGFVGRQQDLQFVNKYMEFMVVEDSIKYTEIWDISQEEQEYLFFLNGAYGAMLGCMLKREIDGAEETVKDLIKFSVWKKKQANWKKLYKLEMEDFEQMPKNFIKAIYAYSRDEIVKPVFHSKKQIAGFEAYNFDPRENQMIKSFEKRNFNLYDQLMQQKINPKISKRLFESGNLIWRGMIKQTTANVDKDLQLFYDKWKAGALPDNPNGNDLFNLLLEKRNKEKEEIKTAIKKRRSLLREHINKGNGSFPDDK